MDYPAEQTAENELIAWWQSLEEMRRNFRHRRNEQAPVQKQVSHFAAGFSNEQTSVASGAVGRAISAAIIRLMIRADWIVRTNSKAIQCVP